jgi:hypothetical protein
MIIARNSTALGTPSWLHNSTLPVRRLLRLSLSQASLHTRGFTVSDASKQLVLERVGQTFIGGYNAALEASDLADVLRYISAIPQSHRGFAVEGAAMGIAVADILPFRKSWFPEYLQSVEHDFTYLAHVGAGWALARVPWCRRRILASLDPVHRWLAFDGLGFHDTYFYHHHILAGWRRQRLGYSARAYDQGVGRALWFVAGGSVEDAIGLIWLFPATRQSDLWSGLGLAITYVGATSADWILGALQSAGPHKDSFAQGVAFGCEARVIACYVPAYTDRIAHAVWGVGAEAVSSLVRQARDRLPKVEGDPPRYELWRRSVAAARSQMAGRRS